VRGGDPQDGEGLWDILLEPGGELRRGLLVTGGDVPKAPFGLGRLVRVEDATDVAGDLHPHGDLRHVGHGVLHEVELAALPGDSGENGLPRCLEPAVVVADDELHTPHTAIDEALKEGSPVRLGLGELHAAAEDAPLAVGADTDSREEGTGHDRSIVADLFVAGIEDEVGDLANRPVPPGAELLVEFSRCAAHLGGGDVEAAEFLDDGRDLPGADALHVHLGDGECHRPFTTDAPFQRPRVERSPILVPVAAGLGNTQVHLANAGLQGLGFKTVGVALTVASSLMRLGLEHLLSLDLHRVVHERGEGGGHGSRTVLDEQSRKVVDRRTFILVGHRRFLLGGVRHFQENLDDPPLQIAPPLGGRPRLATLDSASHPTAIYRKNVALTRRADLFDNARRIARRHVANVVPSLTIDEQVQFIRVRDADELHRALTFAVSQPASHELAELSAGWVANGKAVTQETISLRDVLAQASTGGSEHDALLELRRIRSELAESSYRLNAQRDSAESTARRRSLHEEERRLVHEIGGRLALLSREDPWVGQDEVRGSIAANRTLIDIIRFKVFDFKMQSQDKAWGSERYAAWIVPPLGKGSTRIVDLGDASIIDLAVAAYREAVRAAVGDGGLIAKAGESPAEEVLRETAAVLTEKVLKPIMTGIRAAGGDEGLDELVISPDGELWLVPWAALPLEDGRYLVEQYAVITVTSARGLVAERETQHSASAPLIFADPLFDLPKEAFAQALSEVDDVRVADSESMATGAIAGLRSASEIGHVSRLPGTLNEARRVAGRIEQLTKQKPLTFLQSRALEERVIEL